MTDARQAKDDLNNLSEAFLEGLSTQIEMVHQAHSLSEEGLWSGSDSAELLDLRSWGATSLPRIARIQTEFWRGMFGLYRDQAQQTSEVLRGRLKKGQKTRRTLRARFTRRAEAELWTTNKPFEVANPSNIVFFVEPETTLLLNDANGAIWQGVLHADLESKQGKARVTLSVALDTSTAIPAYPLTGTIEVSLKLAADRDQAVPHSVHVHLEAPKAP